MKKGELLGLGLRGQLPISDLAGQVLAGCYSVGGYSAGGYSVGSDSVGGYSGRATDFGSDRQGTQ